MKIFLLPFIVLSLWACRQDASAAKINPSSQALMVSDTIPKIDTLKEVATTLDTVPPRAQLALEGKSWKVTGITYNGRSIKLSDGNNMVVLFKNDEISGNTSCNQLSGKYEIAAGTLTVSEFSKGTRACEGKIGEEGRFGSILASAKTWKLSGERLATITGEKGEITLMMTR